MPHLFMVSLGDFMIDAANQNFKIRFISFMLDATNQNFKIISTKTYSLLLMTDYHNGHDYLERPLSIWKVEKHVMLAFEFRKNIYTKMTRNQHQVMLLE